MVNHVGLLKTFDPSNRTFEVLKFLEAREREDGTIASNRTFEVLK